MDDPGEYDTFKDLYLDNPQKLLQILSMLVRIGMSREDAQSEVDKYVAKQGGES